MGITGGTIRERDCASGQKCFTASWDVAGSDGYIGLCIDAGACDKTKDIYKHYSGFTVSLRLNNLFL